MPRYSFDAPSGQRVPIEARNFDDATARYNRMFGANLPYDPAQIPQAIRPAGGPPVARGGPPQQPYRGPTISPERQEELRRRLPNLFQEPPLSPRPSAPEPALGAGPAAPYTPSPEKMADLQNRFPNLMTRRDVPVSAPEPVGGAPPPAPPAGGFDIDQLGTRLLQALGPAVTGALKEM
jgi:hypothetical protein